jgi:hypothetical protein
MYDDDPQDPPQCPLCQEELGYGDDCQLCAAETRATKAEAELHRLRKQLGYRVRALAGCGLYVDGDRTKGVSPMVMHALATLYDLAGLPVPAERLAEAMLAVLPEYGEYLNTERDAELVAQLDGERKADIEARAGLTFTIDVLDRRPAGREHSLWFLSMLDGTKKVASIADKRDQDRFGKWSGGMSPSLCQTLRECIDQALDQADISKAHWVEFAMDLVRNPRELVDGARVSFVVGDRAYTAYVGDKHQGAFLGFGGNRYMVRLKDGREFVTNNNWDRGTIPPRLRAKLLPPDAEFVREKLGAAS